MQVSLEWLLTQRDLDLRLVAGVPAGAALTWVHSVDLIDPTEWLSGGELVLTTGLALPRAGRGQREYVERLADHGVAALGFGVGVRFQQIPAPVIDACRERGVPLLEVPRPTPFVAIAQAVARRVSEQEIEVLQVALADQRRFTRAAVRGGLDRLVRLLGKDLQCDAVVIDEYGVVMASSSRKRELLERVGEEWRRLTPDARPGTVGVDIEHGTLEIQILQGRSGVCGGLAVRYAAPLSTTDRLLLNQAAGLITLQLDWPAELIEAYHALGGTLFALLLDLDPDLGARAPALVQHLHHFGFRPRDQVVLLVATSRRGHARLLEVLASRLEAAKRPHVVSRVPAGVAALVLDRDATRLVAQLDDAVETAGLRGVVIGVSSPLAQSDVASGLGSAGLAAANARREGRRVGWFGELTLGAVVADETIRSAVWALAEPVLGDLLRGSSPREADLMASLETFLHHNGSWEAAARDLGIHRHTMRARMARVEALTGLSLDDAESRVLLHLGLMSRPSRESAST